VSEALAASGRFGSGTRPTRAVIIVWALFGLALVAVAVTYSRFAAMEYYHFPGHGFVDGGLSRALVYTNMPLGLAAMLLLLAQADRMSRAQRIGALVAFVLWLPVFSSRVLDLNNLTARWTNVVPALGVVLALVLTLTTPALRPARVRGDGARVVVGASLVLLALPWIGAELGLHYDGVPVLGQIFQTGELRTEPGRVGVHPAVHYGDHHGLWGTLLVISALLVSRMLGAVRSNRLHAALGFLLAGIILYGLMNIANDAWLEQVVKRGWTDWTIPSVLKPAVNWGWLVIIVGAVAVWLTLFTPRGLQRALGAPGAAPAGSQATRRAH
jgi:hypothetical protein